MKQFSSHIFLFPFKWDLKDSDEKVFAERTDLNKIEYCMPSCWERMHKPDNIEDEKTLYNEKNYFYKFVHPILYDDGCRESGLIHHFERKEPKSGDRNVFYLIKTKKRKEPYRLRVDAMNVNLYDTGVGVLSFYLINEIEEQSSPDHILAINQYGRRIMPPFFADKIFRDEIAEYLSIEGLRSFGVYYEDFNGYETFDSWREASFLTRLIYELADNIEIEPIVDDRMYVLSWYKNNRFANQFAANPDAIFKDKELSSFWYRFVFVDGGDVTCKNEDMRDNLLDKATYMRWQELGSLYGVSRYSMVYLVGEGVPDFLLSNFNGIYARMAEIVIVQRATMLRFSGEITRVSHLPNKNISVVFERINSLYKEYIRFINQIYHRDVTAQDQGIELYAMLHECYKMDDCIKDLDHEFQELHEYVSLNEDRIRNNKATILNYVATVFLPITIVTGFFGMNRWSDVLCEDYGLEWQILTIFAGVLISVGVLLIMNKKLKV